ncbi:MAG TPA: pyridoxamine 5'-phosphate oxidase family protein [Acetobacteraceae bacterium]|nr:pyridoxamine 5'-phosphate oxidase family protein [Acetobacteraceae bacterium]
MQDPLPDPFHAGERLAQTLAGVRDRMAAGGAFIRGAMPEQHRVFFTGLPWLAFAAVDRNGWPCGTILMGALGFVAAPDDRTLRIAAAPSLDDPVGAALSVEAGVGILGIDLATRRRNRANGRLTHVTAQSLEIAVQQSFGNCAQYIQRRRIEPRPINAPCAPEALSHLDAPARALITGADTFFVASAAGDAVDMSHRGGRPGFVRADDDVLTIPDFAGNRYFNTLGNFLVSPRAGLLFVDFERGDLLHLSGTVEIAWDSDEARRFEGAQRLWRVRLSHGWRRRGVLPWRWAFLDNASTTDRTGQWETGRKLAGGEPA